MKALSTLILLLLFFCATAQKIESLKVDLYTDSLKKGTYNYINIDGKLSNGKYLPLDTSDLKFTSSNGKFFGNNLYIDPNFSEDRVTIKAILKSDPSLFKEFVMYVKKKPDDEKLKTMDEILNETKNNNGKRRKQL